LTLILLPILYLRFAHPRGDSRESGDTTDTTDTLQAEAAHGR